MNGDAAEATSREAAKIGRHAAERQRRGRRQPVPLPRVHDPCQPGDRGQPPDHVRLHFDEEMGSTAADSSPHSAVSAA